MSSKDKSNNKTSINKSSKDPPKKSSFIERQWTEDTKGEYDNDGFFITPNGSFWDPDGVYFNRDGVDKHGGKYNNEGEYIPGEGWNEEHNCYESELEDFDEFDDQEIEFGHNVMKENDYENLDDDVFESDFQINDDNIAKLFEGIKLEENKDKQNKIKDDNDKINNDINKNEIKDEDKNENEINNEEDKNEEKINEKNSLSHLWEKRLL